MTIYYYQFNIGDYRKDTVHLSLLEHGIYRQLIDTYYTKEGKLEADMDNLMRTHSIRNADEVRAFENVIRDFFVERDGMLTHRGCDKVMAGIYEKSDKAKASARARWDKDANAMRPESERNADGMLSNNHKPITNNHKPSNTATRGSRLPTDWKPNADLAEWSKAERPDLDLRKVFAEFKDYWSSIPGSKGVRLDWDATWRNWIRKQTAAKQTYAQVAADVARTTTPPPANQDAALKQIMADRENCSPPPEHIRAMMKGILGVKNA